MLHGLMRTVDIAEAHHYGIYFGLSYLRSDSESPLHDRALPTEVFILEVGCGEVEREAEVLSVLSS